LQAHLQAAHILTQSKACKRACKQPHRETSYINSDIHWADTEGHATNIEFAAMLADEYILSFISLSAHIQPTEFYQLLLLSSSSVFQSAAAPGWTL
jgi:hypothetical protein